MGGGSAMEPLALLPEMLLAASAVCGLLLGSWLPRTRQWPVAALGGAACVAGLVATAFGATGTAAFEGAFAVDTVTATARVVVLGGTALVLAMGAEDVRGHPREAEFWVLAQLAALGALVLAGARDLLPLSAGFLLASVPAYALAGFRKDGRGTEAALKFYVLGALFGVLLLSGTALLVAAGHGTSYAALGEGLGDAPHGLVAAGSLGVLLGLLFKAGAVPAHFWVPDTVQGSSSPVAALVTTVPKAGALAALYRLVAGPLDGAPVAWDALLAAVACASMTLGNLAAFFQRDVRRLLAYSTVSQIGYLLVPVAVAARTELARPALLFYVAAYALTNLGAFAVVCAVPGARGIDDYRGLGRSRPLLVAALAVCLLGLVGTPPTAVFLGKVGVFGAAVDGGWTWLAAVTAVNTVASLFYYLRWLAPAAFGSAAAERAAGADPLAHGPLTHCPSAHRPLATATAYTAAAASLALGIGSAPVLDLLR
ncbi:NADH-quinone oxidoreductase subunit N [Streptomyces iconiensis]|uniref:NADH-quinone oxidoreductase subunit N n=2 Tax=Streptomyces iconiensis TaxID=1384038 RepID=A0ABT7AAW9_9ACTN|nr:NADH-quinone oxidoreductase subunit N [Streptomyces iconiensis]MDJ1138497.1 NADH-quinone oxidoreductase subunit N [Streptomyces iconiensis]